MLSRARQRRHYERQEALFREIDSLIEALVVAFEHAGCHPILDHLPQERRERIREISRRLASKKLVAFRLEEEMEQLSLPFSGRSNTTRERSRKAAERAAPGVNRRQREVLEWLAACGDQGSTDNATIAHIVAGGGSANGPRARRGELEDKGFVAKSGVERDGSTVWVITPEGRRWLAEREADGPGL